MDGRPARWPASAAALAMLALAACTSAEPGAFPQQPQAKATVTEVTARLALPLPASGRLAAADHTRAAAFLDAYRDGGRGPLLAILTTPGRAAAASAAGMLNALAVKRGLAPGALVVSSAIGGPPALTLTYTDYVAKPPGCSPEIVLGFNPTQALSPNYGCGMEGNIAAMLAHPADLLGPAAETAADGSRAARTVDLYHQGKPTQADVNRNDSLQLSTVGASGK